MLYNININQKESVRISKNLDIVDMSIFYYLWIICSSNHKKIVQNRIKIGRVIFTWVNYRHLIAELPLLHIKYKNLVTNRLQNLEKAGLIKTYLSNEKNGNGRRKYVAMGAKANKLFTDESNEDKWDKQTGVRN